MYKLAVGRLTIGPQVFNLPHISFLVVVLSNKRQPKPGQLESRLQAGLPAPRAKILTPHLLVTLHFEFADEVYYRADVIYWRLWKNAVAQVEDVAGSGAGAL
jgi:hypothetical protein